MISNPIIETYFVSNRQVSEFTNVVKIELINEFIEHVTSLPNSFKIYFINEISEKELYDFLLIQKDKYFEYYKFASINDFKEEIYESIINDLDLIFEYQWENVESQILFESNLYFDLNIYYRYKMYEDQYQFLLINKDLKYNNQYLNNITELINKYFENVDKIINNQIINKFTYPPLNETPFTNMRHYEIFKIISSNFNFEEKKMWTVLFEYLKESVKPKMNISELKYFDFVNRKIIKSEISTRTQKGVNSESYFESFDDFLNNILPN